MASSTRGGAAARANASHHRALLTAIQAVSEDFRGFSERHLDDLMSVLSFVEYDQGEELVTMGEEASWFGLLLGGTLEVVVGDGRVVAELEAGRIIGEMAFFRGGKRNASIRGQDGGTLAVMLFSDMLKLYEQSSECATALVLSLGRASVRKMEQKQEMMGDVPEASQRLASLISGTALGKFLPAGGPSPAARRRRGSTSAPALAPSPSRSATPPAAARPVGSPAAARPVTPAAKYEKAVAALERRGFTSHEIRTILSSMRLLVPAQRLPAVDQHGLPPCASLRSLAPRASPRVRSTSTRARRSCGASARWPSLASCCRASWSRGTTCPSARGRATSSASTRCSRATRCRPTASEGRRAA